MTTHLEAVVTWQLGSGLPTDRSVNTFHFTADDAYDAADLSAIEAAVLGFYTDAHGSDSVVGFFAQAVVQNGHRLVIYDCTVAAPIKTPVLEDVFNLSFEPTNAGFPNEVALVMSFYADLTGTTAAQARRRRGRIFFGPVKTASATQTDYGAKVSDAMVACFTAAGASFKTEVDAIAHNVTWVVWSGMDNAGHEVIGGWVDNAWDTQRRRGLAPISRTYFS